MPLFLAYPTSLEVLRLFRAGFADNGVPVDTEARSPFPGSPSLFEHIPSNETPHDGDVECLLRASHPLWDEALAKPLHLYAGSQKCRGQSRLKRIVTCTTKFPEGAFCHLDDNLWAPNPELCFVEAGRHLSFYEHALLGMELCGCYVIYSSARRGFLRTPPATTRARLLMACDGLSRCHGASQARSVAQVILDQSASPRESALALLLFLPKRLGGYEIPRGILNKRLSSTAIEDGHDIIPDILWSDERTTTEYEGVLDHDGESNLPRDARRKNRLIKFGYKVISVTNSQLQSIRDTDEIAWQTCKHLGLRWRKPRGSYDWRERQTQLRKALALRADQTDFDGWDPVPC